MESHLGSVSLTYLRADGTEDRSTARREEYVCSQWDYERLHERPTGGACWTPQQLPVPSGRATLFLGFHWPDGTIPAADPCPTDRPHDSFVAHVTLPEAGIVVEASGWPDERQVIEAVVRALQPRAPRTGPAA